LQASVAGAGVALTRGAVFAQSGGVNLVRAPKQALVIGNSRYRHAPLRNPVNDAKAMAAALTSAGFGVALQLDLPQSGMQEAIKRFGEELARNKAVGLFYFAGHGAQLAWRNYLIPVDAEIADVQELRERGVDLNGFIEGIRRAGNPMNILILDACRDNPFGSTARIEQKGLSQLDAPPGTFLAYATAPGNTAIDGDGGDHGLYTEHLLREIKVPETKVEDVFKRVRLGVRRRSSGLQIPWESTSLEDDFWFIPPKEVKALAAQETERQFKEELAIWEKIQDATQPGPFEDYLRRYPSGPFTELAQLRLDRALARQGEQKIQIVSAPENPYSKGTVSADTNFKVGDSYTYSITDLYTKVEIRRETNAVARITDTEVHYDSGRITDLLGNLRRYTSGQVSTGGQILGADYSVGKRWITRTITSLPPGPSLQAESEVRVTGRERITIAAGTFYAFVVETQGWATGAGVNIQTRSRHWIAPDRVRLALVVERLRRGRSGNVVLAEREELVSYKQS